MDLKGKLVHWLRDAHALERAVEKILEGHARAARAYPELAERLLSHLGQTHEHVARVEKGLRLLGSDPSASETAAGRILGSLQSAASLALPDPVVTSVAGDYALEHLEISTYTAIVAAAEAADQEEIAELSRRTIAEEKEMADWLREYLPLLSVKYLTA
ncbi:MAG TPA: DUF892 family protein [Opitutaceae bacterium]|jgi:ferritin-like metal-binding protein YciE|nr:DUF892 family protein [Opitutaceae bacterium]